MDDIKQTECLPALIRLAIFGEGEREELAKALAAMTTEEERTLYTLAVRQDMAHLVFEAARRLGHGWRDPSVAGAYQKQQMTAVFRTQNLLHELEQLSAVLEREQIAFIPLKGSVLRGYYPEAWMRTSCDIDVLVKKCDLDAAVKALTEKLSYQAGKLNSHDISLETPSGMHVELHYALIEDFVKPEFAALSDPWSHVLPAPDGTYRRMLSEPFFYAYHLAHMSKHMMHGGGCGLRAFLDLWILMHRAEHESEACAEWLDRVGLSSFAAVSEKLAAVWFGGDAPDERSDALSDWILQTGIYGSLDAQVTMHRRGERDGKLAYVFHRLFLPYERMKWLYPSLTKHPWLLPFFQVRRWFDILVSGRLKKARRELSINAKLNAEQTAKAEALMNDLGLY